MGQRPSAFRWIELPASPVIRTVTGTVTVTVAPSAGEETQDRVDELKRHTGARCPVHRTLAAAGVKFETEWKKVTVLGLAG